MLIRYLNHRSIFCFLLTFVCVSPFSSAESSTISLQAWDNYRTFLKTSLAAGFATSRAVSLNLTYAHRALADWAPACADKDQKRLLKIVEYAENSLQAQMPYGISFFAADFRADLAQAKKLVKDKQCDQFKQIPLWMSEVEKTRAEVR